MERLDEEANAYRTGGAAQRSVRYGFLCSFHASIAIRRQPSEGIRSQAVRFSRGAHRVLVVADILPKLGYENRRDITLGEYLERLRQTKVDKRTAFDRLCKFFEVDSNRVDK